MEPFLSEMRVAEFLNFPYLYAGNLEDDYIFTQCYSNAGQGMIIAAFNDNQVIGLYSGMPLRTPDCFLESWCDVLDKNGVDTINCYYSGELIIQPAFRKSGLGSALMRRFIQEVETMGFNKIMGVTSIREQNHSLRPQNYFDTDTVWGKHGFNKMDFIIPSSYPTRQADGSVKDQKNKLACWVRDSRPLA